MPFLISLCHRYTFLQRSVSWEIEDRQRQSIPIRRLAHDLIGGALGAEKISVDPVRTIRGRHHRKTASSFDWTGPSFSRNRDPFSPTNIISSTAHPGNRRPRGGARTCFAISPHFPSKLGFDRCSHIRSSCLVEISHTVAAEPVGTCEA